MDSPLNAVDTYNTYDLYHTYDFVYNASLRRKDHG